ALPSRSPTTRSSCASPTRSLGTQQGYEGRSVGDTGLVARMLLSPELSDSVERSADPTAARALLTRLVEDHPPLGEGLSSDARVRGALVALSAASRSLSSAVVRDPSLLDPLLDGDSFVREHGLSEYRESAAGFVTPSEDGRAALRRWKQRELLRIAARD